LVKLRQVLLIWGSRAKGGETTGSLIASNEATVGVSMAKGGETIPGILFSMRPYEGSWKFRQFYDATIVY